MFTRALRLQTPELIMQVSRHEFLSRQRQLKRESNIVSAILLVIFFSCLFGNVWFTRTFDTDSWSPAAQIAYLIAFFGFLIGFIVLSVWLPKHHARKHQCFCL